MTYRSITTTILSAALAAGVAGLAGCDVGAVDPLRLDRATATEVSGSYRTDQTALDFAIQSDQSGPSLLVSDPGGELLTLVNTGGVHLAVRAGGVALDDAQADADAYARLSALLESPRWAAAADLASELESMTTDGSLAPEPADLLRGAVSATEAIAGPDAVEPQSYCCQRLFWSDSCDWDGRPNGCYYWGWLCDPRECGGPW